MMVKRIKVAAQQRYMDPQPGIYTLILSLEGHRLPDQYVAGAAHVKQWLEQATKEDVEVLGWSVERIKQASDEKCSLENYLSQARERISTLEVALKVTTDRVSRAEKELDQSSARIEFAERERDEAIKYCNELRKHIEQMEEKLARPSMEPSERERDLEVALEEVREKRDVLARRVACLEVFLKEQDEENRRLQERINLEQAMRGGIFGPNR